MDKQIEYEGYKIDEKSQKILIDLYVHGTSETPEIRRRLEIENNNTISYRLREYLVPSGLVELSDEIDRNRGSAKPAKVWELTVRGRRYVSENRDLLEAPSNAMEVRNTAQNAQELAEESLSRVSQLEGQEGYLAQLQDELQDHLDDLERLDDLVAQIESEADRAQSERRKAADERREAASLAGEIGAGIDDLDDDLGRLSDDVTDLNNRLNDLRQRFSTLGDSTNERFGEIKKTQRRHDNRIDSLGAEMSEMQDRLDKIEDRLETPWYRRIFS